MLDRKHRLRRAGTSAAIAIAVVMLASCGDSTGPNNKQNALRPAGKYSRQILHLTEPFFWVAVVVGLGVIAGTFYVALRFREKPGEERAPKQVHGNAVLEISWTVIPAVILAIMAVPTVATIFSLAKKPTGPNVVHVTVTARQWWWEFSYTDKGSEVETANELHIPVGQPISLTLQTPECSPKPCYNNGVIHSFWVPALNGKKDVVPGRHQFLKLEADQPGMYMGQCAEYCGLSHADMRLRVFAQTPAEYQAWVQSQLAQKTAVAALERGVNNPAYQCASCHSFTAGTPGIVAPNLAHLADRTAFAGDKYLLNYDNLWKWVYDAPSRKPMGKLTQHMPNFSAQGMSQAEAQKIACFLLTNTATNPSPTPPECVGK
ncbi:MAG TPA: cytochrome c oxidase subunit II [Acidimicrobiia bacterium]|jgi:cytochrome c oxidase subunit 2|nr:cytochrome c oxidase subunit II [Acidimicrobiia bacterium]